MYTGTIHVGEDLQSSALMPHLAECLRRARARDVTVDGNRIAFKGGLFRPVSNWNVLVPFGTGELEFLPTTREVRYRLSLAQLIVAATVTIGFLAVLMFCLPQSEGSGSPPAGFVPVALALLWVFLVGGNLLIGIERFRSFLRQSISTTPART
jgi:hypothetical protein